MEMGSVIREGISKLKISNMLIMLSNEQNLVEDFQMFEAIVSYCYSGLQCKSDEHRVLLSREPVLWLFEVNQKYIDWPIWFFQWTTRLTTELITEVMFEKFDIPSISFVKTPVMVA